MGDQFNCKPISYNPVYNYALSSVQNLYDYISKGVSCFSMKRNEDPAHTTAMVDTFVRTTPTCATSDTKPSNIKVKGYNLVETEIVPGCYITKCDYVNTARLKDDLKVRLALLAQKAKEMGFTLVIGDGFRSHATQRASYEKDPSLRAKEGTSAHEYGAAVDLAFIKKDKNGKDVLCNDFRKLPEFVEFAKSIGLEWGLEACGRKDQEYWHFQLANWTERPDIAPEYVRYNNTSPLLCVK